MIDPLDLLDFCKEILEDTQQFRIQSAIIAAVNKNGGKVSRDFLINYLCGSVRRARKRDFKKQLNILVKNKQLVSVKFNDGNVVVYIPKEI